MLSEHRIEMKDVFDDAWQSISALGLPIFYLIVLVLFAGVTPDFAFLKWLFVFALLEAIGATIKLAYPTERPVKMKRNTFLQKYLASSFPSVHSARAATLLMLCFFTVPNNNVLLGMFLLLALGIGYSRMYVKKHYLKDVVAGWLLGIGIGYLGGLW